MSQFMICETNADLNEMGCIKLFQCKENKRFITRALKNILHEVNVDKLWVLKDIDKHFIETQKKLHDGTNFNNTELYNRLNILCDLCDKIILWYGSDFEELDKIMNKEDFLCNVAMDIENTVCESYLFFIKKYELLHKNVLKK